MIKGKLCIGILTKNCSGFIENVLENARIYGECFDSYEVLIIDGHSHDGTAEICQDWCDEEPTVRHNFYQQSQGLLRMDSIVEARNHILDFFSSQFGPDVYLMLMDGDHPNGQPVDINTFLTCFDFQQSVKPIPEWDALFPNQHECYYDTWALRDVRMPMDYQVMFEHLSWEDGSIQQAIQPYQTPFPASVGFWEVDSAFGGTAIYKTTSIVQASARYAHQLPGDIRSQCEHVLFNKALRLAGKKLYINCQWYNSG